MDEICHPLTQGAAQARYLRKLGLRVDLRPDGRPLVNRAHYDAVRGGAERPGHAPGPQWKKRA